MAENLFNLLKYASRKKAIPLMSNRKKSIVNLQKLNVCNSLNKFGKTERNHIAAGGGGGRQGVGCGAGEAVGGEGADREVGEGVKGKTGKWG